MALSRFTSGPPEAVKKLNEMVDALNVLLNMRGDDKFISLIRGQSGSLIRFNPYEVIRRVPKPPAAATTSSGPSTIQINVDDSPLYVTARLIGYAYCPAACTIRACAIACGNGSGLITDTFGVTITGYGSESVFGASSLYDTTLSGWVTSISANTWLPVHITGTPIAATWIAIALVVQ